MTLSHGMMTEGADGRMGIGAFANPDNVLRGTPEEQAFDHLSSPDGNTRLGLRDCGAGGERLIDYPCPEIGTVIEGAVGITADRGEIAIGRAQDGFFRTTGPSGLWRSQTRFPGHTMRSPGCSNSTLRPEAGAIAKSRSPRS